MPSIVRLAGSGTVPVLTPMLSSVNPFELGDGLGLPAPWNVTLSRLVYPTNEACWNAEFGEEEGLWSC